MCARVCVCVCVCDEKIKIRSLCVCVCVCVCVWDENIKICSFINFQVYNTVSLTVITMLYVKFPELIHLTLWPGGEGDAD